MDLNDIRQQAAQATTEICDTAHLQPGQLFVVGCASPWTRSARHASSAPDADRPTSAASAPSTTSA